MSTQSWASETSGFFSTGTNWSPTGVPTTTSTVIFNKTGGTAYTATISGGNSTIAQLNFNSADATLVWQTGIARSLTVSGTTTLTAGTINLGQIGGASTSSLAAKGGMTINGGTFLLGLGNLNVGQATNASTTFAISSGTFNESGGAVTVAGTVALVNITGGTDTFSAGTFTTGTLTVGGSSTLITLSGGTVTTTVNSATANTIASTDSIVMSNSSLLDFTNAGANATAGFVDSGLVKGSGTLKGVISGSGTVDASGGKLDVTSNVGSSVVLQVGATAASTLELDATVASGGSASFNASPAGVSTLDLHNTTALAAFNGGGATVGNMDFIATSSTPTVVQEIDAETVAFSSVASATLTNSNKTITLFNSGHTALATFTLTGTAPAGTPFVDWSADAGTGTDVFLSSAVCYASGTRILTPDGEKSVDDIVAGDLVMTLVGEAHVPQVVKWVGERHINMVAHPRPELVAPVRIQRDAFGAGLPARDLLVSPDHCMFVDGKLIPAKLLINGMSIVQERDTRSVQYFHIELDHHAVLLAEGLPAESYLDTGNRAYFTNSGLALVLHPEFHVNAGLKCWEEDACAPLAVDAETVEPVWRTLAARAESLGHSQPTMLTTEDSDLRLVANGRTIRPVSVSGDRYTFVLPVGASDVRLASRTAIPSDRAAWLDDWRRLGVAVKRIVVRSGEDLMDIPADHPALREGWYKAEGDAATIWRWTDGNARLPIALHSEAATVEVHVGITAAYPVEPAERLAA